MVIIFSGIGPPQFVNFQKGYQDGKKKKVANLLHFSLFLSNLLHFSMHECNRMSSISCF